MPSIPRESPRDDSVVYGADYTSIPLSQLQLGVTLRYPILDPCGILLIAAGLSLTPSMLQRLKNRGILIVRVHRNEVDSLLETDSKHSALQSPDANSVRVMGRPTVENPPPTKGAYEPRVQNKLIHTRDVVASQTTDLHAAMAKDKAIRYEAPLALVKEAWNGLTTDQDLTLSLISGTPNQHTRGHHSCGTANLAMAMARTLGYPDPEILQLGVGCLLHDSGMLKLRSNAAEQERKLTLPEYLEITKHVGAAADMVGNIRDIPQLSRKVAGEIHERADGTGYPRRRIGSQIHPLSRIASVADCYTAMISHRPYRAAFSPYQSVQYLLYRTKTGRFDSQAVRALLHTISLFPIGSLVRLSDNRVGKIVRSNGVEMSRPVVSILAPNGESSSEVVDLVHHRQLTITDVLDSAVPVASGT